MLSKQIHAFIRKTHFCNFKFNTSTDYFYSQWPVQLDAEYFATHVILLQQTNKTMGSSSRWVQYSEESLCLGHHSQPLANMCNDLNIYICVSTNKNYLYTFFKPHVQFLLPGTRHQNTGSSSLEHCPDDYRVLEHTRHKKLREQGLFVLKKKRNPRRNFTALCHSGRV